VRRAAAWRQTENHLAALTCVTARVLLAGATMLQRRCSLTLLRTAALLRAPGVFACLATDGLY